MRISLLLVLLVTLAATAQADQNPAPTSVGLSNYSTVTLSTTPSQMLSRNTNRAGFTISNNGAVSIVVKPGSAPANATDGIVIPTNTTLQFNSVPIDSFYGESASSTAKVILMEFAK